MRTRISLFLILVAFALFSTGAGARSGPSYQVETGTVAGGEYRLVSFRPRVDSVSAGGAYRLLGPSAPELGGSGCCCTYLPCILLNK